MEPTGQELDAQSQAEMVRVLREQLGATLIETHISYVLVAGEHAYKFKKVLTTAFLDQSTRARRRHACDEELRLNRRLAPALYEAVVDVTGTPRMPVLAGPGPAIDHAVRMRSFAQDGLWEQGAARGDISAADIDELATQLVAFHAQAAVLPPSSALGSAAVMRRTVLQNLSELEEAGAGRIGAPDTLDRLRRWEAAAFQTVGPRADQRRAAGCVRECHGDLHLGNVTRVEGRTTVFDGIEFSESLRWVDVMADVAFMAMDLRAHGLAAWSHRFVNAYLDASGDADGLPVLDYQGVHRALVRAKVSLLRAAQASATGKEATDAARYLGLALQLTQPRQRRLFLTHGCSGSGKSTFTQELLQSEGAIRYRSDVERRRLSAAPGSARYGGAMNAATYEHLARLAQQTLLDGHPVIVDATFLRRADRKIFRGVAEALAVPVTILDFATGADVGLMRQRVAARAELGLDASEADGAVLDAQLAAIEPLDADERVIAQHCWPQAGSGP